MAQMAEEYSSLFMSNTSIADTMPDWFWDVFSRADLLDISSNNISGTLPATLGQIEAYFLDLSSNQFTGSVQQIPSQIQTLDLSRNSLSGPSPSLNVKYPMLVNGLIFFLQLFHRCYPTINMPNEAFDII